jgi:predicted site-specific integrase-resolvase
MAARSTSSAPPAAAEQLMTVPQWAALLGVARTTAYRIVSEGLVEPTNVSSSLTGRPRLRISETAHAAYLKRRKLASSAPRRGVR